MPSVLKIDIETYSPVDIDCGLDNYKQSAELLLLAYKIDDLPTRLWDVPQDKTPPPAFISAFYDPSVTLVAHNAAFERIMLNQFGFESEIERWQCSMARALSHALPDDLDTLGKVLGLAPDAQKISAGRRLIGLFCKPLPENRKLRRADRTTHPADWALFCDYCVRDVDVLHEVWQRLPLWNWSPRDVALWHLDQRINSRGFYADGELAAAGARAATTEKALLASRFAELTGGLAPTQRAKVQEFINTKFGMSLTSTAKPAVEPLVKDKSKPADLREIAQILLAANKSSTAKYPAVQKRISPDGRLRGALQFAGAGRTRRWAGRGAQFQNLPSRGLPPAEKIEEYIDMLKIGVHDLFFDNLMLYGAAALRGLVVVPEGKRLVCADLSNIEGRMLAWVSGEKWKLQAFREYDAGTGPDLYNITANMIIGVDPWKVSKKDRNAFGKVPDLACVAGNTPVVTQRGLVAIKEVLPTDLVWDGVEWVKQDGVIDRGVRQVVNVDGIEATPDHLVLTGVTWRRAQELVSNANMMSLALATASVNLPSSAWSMGLLVGSARPKSDAPAAQSRTTLSCPIFDSDGLRGATCAPSSAAPRRAKSIGGTNTFALTPTIAGGCLIGLLPASTGAETRTTQHPPTMEGAASGSSRLGSRVVSSFSRTGSRLMDGMSLALNWIGATLTEGTSRGTCDSSPKLPIDATNVPSESCSSELPTSKPVYDLLNAGPRNRFMVKTDSGYLIVHNCGYRGGVPGFQNFAKAYSVRMADHWGTIQSSVAQEHIQKAKSSVREQWAVEQQQSLDISELEWVASESCKLAWRARHPATVAFWYDLQDAVINAIRAPGATFPVGEFIHVGVRQHGGHPWLLIRLPSGNFITYFHPGIEPDGRTITYWGMASSEGSTTRAWVKCYTHGGKLTGNVCQTTARDLLAYNLQPIEDAGYEIVLTVHDEVVTEAPDTDAFSHEHLSSILATNPPWAPGLPLAAAGFVSYRYKKD